MNIQEILKRYERGIIDEWVERLHTEVSERYSSRPLDELFLTVSKAAEANYYVLLHNDCTRINSHIRWITKLRLEEGFSLPEVQNAYELYRIVLLPLLIRELDEKDYLRTLKILNDCLFYTIKRFSNYFQRLHERYIMTYAKNLEREVEKRTKALKTQEEKYRILLENMNDGYFVAVDEYIVFANRAFAEMHGVTLEEVTGRPFVDFISPSSLNIWKEIKDLLREPSDKERFFFYLRRHKKGVDYPTELKAKCIFFDGLKSVAGILRDITERIELEKRIRETERFAHLGRIATCIAHEIRNPLSSVKVNVQILAKNLNVNGNNRRRLEIIEGEIVRLENILSNVLDFSKPLILNPKETKIEYLLKECAELLEEKAREKSVRFVLKISKALPSLNLDRDKIKQALWNILVNAFEAVQREGRIEVSVSKKQRYLSVRVSDDGCGIRKDDLPFIFDPFFSTKPKGVGLGLALAKKIVEAHGGRILVKRRKPRGTHFLILLPFEKT